MQRGVMAAKKNVRSQKQFRGGYVPDQPVDEWDRSRRTEPSSPTKSRARQGIQVGSQTQARPGLAGMQDYKRKPKKGR